MFIPGLMHRLLKKKDEERKESYSKFNPGQIKSQVDLAHLLSKDRHRK